MLDHELRQPLRRKTWRDRMRERQPSPLQFATFLVVGGALVFGWWLSTTPDPGAGEPVVHLKIEPIDPVATASIAPAAANGPAEEATAPDDFAPADDAPADLELTETASTVILAPPVRLAAAPAAGYFEKGPDGLLPKKSANGRRPFDVYSRPIHKALLQSSQPKIALLIGGMGLNSEFTSRAISDLPPEVTFAFAPYGDELQGLIDRARSAGHEVMLHLPMEPFGYPGNNPGPRTLLASAKPEENLTSLSWLLSRFSGYTGVVNYLGARFTSETPALEPVLRKLKDRGLVYLDDGTSSRSRSVEIADEMGLPARQARLVIDPDDNFNAITDNLRRLETMAQSGSGVVIGIGTGLPATIDAVESWAKGLESRGILLVPVSAGFRS
jgi:polysaccharide deacetylase 2 family uncharacterized protein YibQ